MWSALLSTALLLQATHGAPRAGCSVSINSDLTEPQPLILKNNWSTADAFVLPVDTSGTLSFSAGETFQVACPGSNLVLGGTSTTLQVTSATCVSAKTFTVNGGSVAFSGITCKSIPSHSARYSGGTCSKSYKEVEIGFEVSSTFIPLIKSCFDEATQNVLYSTFELTKTIGGYQVGYPRPGWTEGSFFSVGTPNVDALYSRAQQRTTINALLGLNSDDTTYVHGTNDYFLSRGHLTAKADFVYGSQHRLTFYFVNAAPQWQTFNGGNWNTAEDDVRAYASSKYVDLTVYTGTYGVTTLPHASTGNETELYLYVNGNAKGIPVPELYWKVVYNPQSKAGVVLLGVNNPYKTSVTPICTDVSAQISWLKWKAADQKSGLSYACAVDDFRKTVDYLPSFSVSELLK